MESNVQNLSRVWVVPISHQEARKLYEEGRTILFSSNLKETEEIFQKDKYPVRENQFSQNGFFLLPLEEGEKTEIKKSFFKLILIFSLAFSLMSLAFFSILLEQGIFYYLPSLILSYLSCHFFVKSWNFINSENAYKKICDKYNIKG